MPEGNDLIGRSVLELVTDQRKLDRGIRQGKRKAKSLEKDFTGVGDTIKNVFGGIGVALALRQLVRYADEWTQINNQLKVVTNSAQELAIANSEIFAIAQRTRGPIDATVKLYSRLALSAEDLGASQSELLRFTEGINQALAITGSSGQEAKGALLQLSQAMSNAKVQAQEFNSIADGAPRILIAVAEGLGVNRGELKKLVNEGKITSREFFDAFMSQLPKLSEEFSRTDSTIGQALTGLNNSLTRFTGKADESTGASKFLAKAIASVSEAVDDLTESFNKTEIKKLEKELSDLEIQAASYSRFTNESTAAIEKEMEAIQKRLVVLREEKRVKDAAKGGGGKAGEKLSKQQAAIDLIEQELLAKRTLAEFEGPQREAMQELMRVENSLRKEGIDIKNEEVQATLDGVYQQTLELGQRKQLADAVKKQQAQVAAHAAAQKSQIKGLQKQFGSSMGAITVDLFSGKMAFEDFTRNTIKLIGQLIVQLIALKIASSFLGGFVGGAGSQAVAGAFGGARAEGGDVESGKSYLVGEKGPELFTPKSSGFITPNKGMGGINVSPNISISGMDFGDDAAAERVAIGVTRAVRNGVTEALDLAGALADASNLNPNRAAA